MTRIRSPLLASTLIGRNAQMIGRHQQAGPCVRVIRDEHAQRNVFPAFKKSKQMNPTDLKPIIRATDGKLRFAFVWQGETYRFERKRDAKAKLEDLIAEQRVADIKLRKLTDGPDVLAALFVQR